MEIHVLYLPQLLSTLYSEIVSLTEMKLADQTSLAIKPQGPSCLHLLPALGLQVHATVQLFNVRYGRVDSGPYVCMV